MCPTAPRVPLVVAHRGASHDAPEHTRAAYELAIERGADSIEVDLRLTADGELVCVHDETLERVAGDPRRVADVTSAQLAELDAGSWFNRAHPDRADQRFVGQTVVRFADHLRWMRRHAPHVGCHVELKDPSEHGGRMEEAVADVLAEHRATPGVTGRVIIETFDVRALHRLRELLPDVDLGLLWLQATDELVAARFPLRVAVSGPSIWSLFFAPEHVDAAHRAGVEVHVWTANEDEEFRELAALRVDAIVTDRPGRLRALLES